MEDVSTIVLQLAKRKCLMKGNRRQPKFDPATMEQILAMISSEHDGDHLKNQSALFALDQIDYLETFLWPNFTPSSTDNHVLSIAIIAHDKHKRNTLKWELLSQPEGSFHTFFQRVLQSLCVPTKRFLLRKSLLCFIEICVQSLENAFVRAEVAPLVSIGIWAHLSSSAKRDRLFQRFAKTRKTWRISQKKLENADEDSRKAINFERSWIFSMTLDFIDILYQKHSEDAKNAALLYCECFLDILIDLESQIPTRRYLHYQLQDLNLLVIIRKSPLYINASFTNIRYLVDLLDHYMWFAIDEHTGRMLSKEALHEIQTKDIINLQMICLRHYPEKLKLLALSNFAVIRNSSELMELLEPLLEDELLRLCELLNLRTSYPAPARLGNSATHRADKLLIDRDYLAAFIVDRFKARPTYAEQARELAILPTEELLYNDLMCICTKYEERPIPVPKMTLQYLSTEDFIWRAFQLSRLESLFAIKADIEEAIRRLQPRIMYPTGKTKFDGYSKMALRIFKPAILEVGANKIGEDQPSFVKADVVIDLESLPAASRRDWDTLRYGEVVFLLTLRATDATADGTLKPETESYTIDAGLKCIRTAEVIQVLAEDGRPLNVAAEQNWERFKNPSKRLLRLHLDARQYNIDSKRLLESDNKDDIWASLNVIVRRRQEENNFKSTLQSLQNLTQNPAILPAWFQDIFSGIGNSLTVFNYSKQQKLDKLDVRDIFCNFEHVSQSFPFHHIKPISDGQTINDFNMYYRLKEEFEHETGSTGFLAVETYVPPKASPYYQSMARQNSIKFTPKQIEAIYSGCHQGLTMIIGPPGTGKTDVAAQIIRLLYHNFPNEKTLVIARSNRALNQLFEKIVALDIHERHLLRLGHGEEELDTASSFGNVGRVEYFMERRNMLLTEVNRLAKSINIPGAHGKSCETALYFDKVHIRPKSEIYTALAKNVGVEASTVLENFPFSVYFAQIVAPLKSCLQSRDYICETLQSCICHLESIFTELSDIRPFELLSNSTDRANYLLTNEARVIAMTSTYASMRREEIVNMGFHYHNVIVEESAQLTEVETFIPLTLQKPKDNGNLIKRIILIGDHQQNPPVIQHLALKQMEQTLFVRLLRLDIKAIQLDAQGRARPSIADLYRWRYANLGDLDNVTTLQETKTANAGFKYEYQFINTEDYQGTGETKPSPHFIQNLGEAEYSVAIFQYMRLLGYPAEKISILTTYIGQRILIEDILRTRCVKNPLFGLPRNVSTVDRFQGDQNDYIILSLVRTKNIGFLRHVNRLTVALSRARLGLYILGHQVLFESVSQIGRFTEMLFARSTKLEIVTKEMWPASRMFDQQVESVTMEGVEHLGKYVYEMGLKAVEARTSKTTK